MPTSRRIGWVGGVSVGVVGLLAGLAGAVQAYPLIDFGTDRETVEKLHGRSVMEIGAVLLLVAAVSFALARCWGSTAATVGSGLCLAVLIAAARGHHNVSVFALGLVASGVAVGVLARRDQRRTRTPSDTTGR